MPPTIPHEYIQDIVGAMVVGGTQTNIVVTYDDINGKLNFVGSVGVHNILSATHSDTLADTILDGDVLIGNVTPKLSRLGIIVPAANVRNVFGVDNAELRPSWKTALDGTTPATIVAGGAGAAGTSLVFAHRDHNHPAPATWPAALTAVDTQSVDMTFSGGNLSADFLGFGVCSTLTHAGINAGITALGANAGQLELVRGTFVVGATIPIQYSNTSIVGNGWGTILDSSAWTPAAYILDLTGKSKCTISDLYMKGKGTGPWNQFTISSDGDYNTYQNLLLENSDGYAININGQYNLVAGCTIKNSYHRAIAANYYYHRIVNNFIKAAGSNAMYVDGLSYSAIVGNVMIDSSAIGIYQNGYCNTIVGNLVRTSGNNGINVGGGNANVVAGTILDHNYYHGIYANWGNYTVISGVACYYNGDNKNDIDVDNAHYTCISGMTAASTGGYSHRAVYLEGSNYCLAANVVSVGHDTCGIELASGVDYNIVGLNCNLRDANRIVDNSAATHNMIFDHDLASMITWANHEWCFTKVGLYTAEKDFRLDLYWNEDEDTANRTLNLTMGGADRTLNINANGTVSQWNTAYGWGNHASAGYAVAATETLAVVCTRGASYAGTIVVTGLQFPAMGGGGSLTIGNTEVVAGALTLGLNMGGANRLMTLNGDLTIPTAATGWLHNNGTGTFAYSTPSYSDVGAAAVGHTHSGVYEPVITAGTTGQYWRGDKSWQTLDATAVGLGTASTPGFAGLGIGVAGAANGLVIVSTGTIGLGAGKGLMTFTDAATDAISFDNCNVGIGGFIPASMLSVGSAGWAAARIYATCPASQSVVYIGIEGESYANGTVSTGMMGYSDGKATINYGVQGWVIGSTTTGRAIYARCNGGSGTQHHFEDADGNYSDATAWHDVSDPARKALIRPLVQMDADKMWDALGIVNVMGYRYKSEAVIGWDKKKLDDDDCPTPIYGKYEDAPERYGFLADDKSLPEYLVSADRKGIAPGRIAAWNTVCLKVAKAKIEELEARLLMMVEKG